MKKSVSIIDPLGAIHVLPDSFTSLISKLLNSFAVYVLINLYIIQRFARICSLIPDYYDRIGLIMVISRLLIG